MLTVGWSCRTLYTTRKVPDFSAFDGESHVLTAEIVIKLHSKTLMFSLVGAE